MNLSQIPVPVEAGLSPKGESCFTARTIGGLEKGPVQANYSSRHRELKGKLSK